MVDTVCVGPGPFGRELGASNELGAVGVPSDPQAMFVVRSRDESTDLTIAEAGDIFIVLPLAGGDFGEEFHRRTSSISHLVSPLIATIALQLSQLRLRQFPSVQ